MHILYLLRSNIRCTSPRILHFSYMAHNLEDTAQCDAPNTCIDYMELDFPTYSKKERTCGRLSTLRTLMGFDGMTGLNAELVTNRATERPGLNLFVYCVDPEFDQNAIPLNENDRKKRSLGGGSNCTSPNGRGPRNEPQLPPPVCCNDSF